MSGGDWIATYLGSAPGSSPNPCSPTPSEGGPILVDGHPATFWTERETVGCGGTYAFVPVDTRMYVFVAWRNGNEGLVKAYLSTVRFQP